MPKISKEEFLAEVRGLRDDYSPNEETLKAISRVSLVTIAGPSGAGKDTIRKRLHGIPKVICDTIRPPQVRDGRTEESGVDYVFRHGKLHKVLADLHDGKYVQFGMGPSDESFYGSRPKQYPEEGPAIIDVMADQLPALRDRFAAGVCSIYIVPPPKLWTNRLKGRGELDPAELKSRELEARTSLTSATEDSNTFFILNEDMRRAADETRRVIDSVSAGENLAENPRIDWSRELLAREAAEEIIAMLGPIVELVPAS